MAHRVAPTSRVDLARLCAFFVAVAEERHFGAAADTMGTTQPTVSQGIQRLEAHLGVRLLDRTRGGAVVTAAGRRLLPLARTLVRDATHLEAAARDLADRDSAFALGAASTVPGALVSAAAAAMRGHAGAVTVTMSTTSRSACSSRAPTVPARRSPWRATSSGAPARH